MMFYLCSIMYFMINTIFLSANNNFSLNFEPFLNSIKLFKPLVTVKSKDDCVESVLENQPELAIIDFDSISGDSMFLIRELLQMSSSLQILLITTGLPLNLLKTVSKFKNLQILYKPFDEKMFYEKLNNINDI